MSSISDVVSGILDDYYSSVSSKSKSTEVTADSKDSNSPKALSNTSLQRYFESASSDDLSAKSIFEKLSIDVGGGGKTITEDQLNEYITKAEDGDISISDNELSGLKELQANWDEVSDGSDSITYNNVFAAGYQDTLLSMAPDDTSDTTDYMGIAKTATQEAYSKIVNAALSTSTSGSPKSNLSSMLNTLLTGTTDKEDDSNAETIAALVNLISSSTSTSTIETEV